MKPLITLAIAAALLTALPAWACTPESARLGLHARGGHGQARRIG